MVTLVTGATGLLGWQVVDHLLSHGELVRILVRPPVNRADVLVRKGAELHEGDITKPETLSSAFYGVKRVVHSAARVQDWGTHALFYNVNVVGTQNVLREAVKQDVEHFVHISSTAVYGYPDCSGITEDSQLQKRGMPYGDTKVDAEHLLVGNYSHRLPISILRPTNIYGPRSIFVTRFAEFLHHHYILHVGGGQRNAGLAYVDNVAAAVILILARPEVSIGQSYNVHDGLSVSWCEYIHDLAVGLGTRYLSMSFPRSLAFKTAWALENIHNTFGLNKHPWFTRTGVELIGTSHDFSTEKVQKELSFSSAVSYAEGIQRTLDWLQNTQDVF